MKPRLHADAVELEALAHRPDDAVVVRKHLRAAALDQNGDAGRRSDLHLSLRLHHARQQDVDQRVHFVLVQRVEHPLRTLSHHPRGDREHQRIVGVLEDLQEIAVDRLHHVVHEDHAARGDGADRHQRRLLLQPVAAVQPALRRSLSSSPR